MSVINNVLKDLETRESKFIPIEITSVESAPLRGRGLNPLLWITLLLLLLAAAGWISLQNQLLSTEILTPPPIATNFAEVAEPATDPVFAGNPPAIIGAGIVTEQMIGNQIVGLQIRESEQEMHLEFVLRENVVAYLKDRGENSFGYHLRGVESQIVAPEITDNRWIEKLAIVSSGLGVDINFKTAAEILVETRQKLIDGEPVWAISLRKSTPLKGSEPDAVIAGKPAGDATISGSEQEFHTATSVVAVAERSSAQSAPVSENETTPAVVKLEIKSTNPNAKSSNQLEYAVELINSGRAVEAENLLQGLLSGAEDYNARRHLLVLYGRQNRGDRFARLVRESMENYPDDVVFKTEYARSLFQHAAYRHVIRLLADASGLDANQQALVAASYQRLDEHDDAVRHYQLALAQDSSNAKNWIGLGISQEHTSALEDALNSYHQAGKLGNLNARLQDFVDKRSNTLRQVLN